MEEEDNSVMTRMTKKLAALKHEDNYDSKRKVTKWLLNQCRPTEELSSTVLQIETLDQNETFQPIEPPGLEDYCRKISMPPTISKPDNSFFIKYYDMDLLNSSKPVVIAATTDFARSSGLAGALNQEMVNSDFLFSQWNNVGEVVMSPMFGNRSHRRTYYMILAYTEKHEVTQKAMQQCFHDLAQQRRSELGISPCG